MTPDSSTDQPIHIGASSVVSKPQPFTIKIFHYLTQMKKNKKKRTWASINQNNEKR